ncbi:lytic transglycosylase domain-containing protein, partial [candidate division KSB1 bacterium]
DEKIADRIAQRESMGLTKMLQDYLYKKYDTDAKPETQPGNLNMPEIPAKRASENMSENPLSLLNKVRQFDHEIRKVAEDIQLDPDLIRAVIAKESSGNPLAVSQKGAKGLMQLMDETAQEMGVRDVLDPEDNIRAGAGYLKKMLVKFNGDLPLALAAYNAGPGAVGVYSGMPPYPETQNFVESVMIMQEKFRRGEEI